MKCCRRRRRKHVYARRNCVNHGSVSRIVVKKTIPNGGTYPKGIWV